MDFDVSKVYTAVNAHKLNIGDLVLAADTMVSLRTVVKYAEERYPDAITAILPEDDEYRFVVAGESNYQLAYLVCTASNAEAYRAWRYGEPVEMQTDTDWRDVDSDELEENPDDWLYRNLRVKDSTHYSPCNEQYRPYKSVDELVSDFKERFDTHTPAYAMPLIWVQRKDKNEKFLITGFTSTENGEFVMIGNVLFGLGVLFDDYTFLDGSPCGVQE